MCVETLLSTATKVTFYQGRLTWWNPNGDEDEEEEEEEEEEEATIIEKKSAVRMLPEVGPPLLTPLSEDSMVDHMVPWTVELSSRLFPDQGVVAVHSNLWPGAHAFFNGEYVSCLCLKGRC